MNSEPMSSPVLIPSALRSSREDSFSSSVARPRLTLLLVGRYCPGIMKKKTLFAFLGASALTLAFVPALMAQDSDADLRAEIDALKQGQQQINQQLQEIKKLLQARPAAAPRGPDVEGKIFDLGDNPVKGASTAKLTLVEFTDYQ